MVRDVGDVWFAVPSYVAVVVGKGVPWEVLATMGDYMDYMGYIGWESGAAPLTSSSLLGRIYSLYEDVSGGEWFGSSEEINVAGKKLASLSIANKSGVEEGVLCFDMTIWEY